MGIPRICAIVAAAVLTPALSPAQGFGAHGSDPAIHGVPPSVTSFGFGGHPGFHGVPPSVTSLGFGNTPRQSHFNNFRTGHRRNNGFINPFYGVVYYAPYAYSGYSYDVMEPGVDDSMEEEYAARRPGAFDGSGVSPRASEEDRSPDDYRTEVNRRRSREESPESETPRPSPVEQPVKDQPNTVLVFKDGHRQEVGNYAIIGLTLYDLSEGRTKKVALAELDVAATVKQNDERGVEFKLPVVAAN